MQGCDPPPLPLLLLLLHVGNVRGVLRVAAITLLLLRGRSMVWVMVSAAVMRSVMCALRLARILAAVMERACAHGACSGRCRCRHSRRRRSGVLRVA